MPRGFVVATMSPPANAPAAVPSPMSLQCLPDDLDGLIVEVRVEQDMSRPTKFAVRFEEDICDGEHKVLTAKSIELGTLVAVLVPDEHEALVCLVAGQVTKLKSSAVTGGPGSWLEIHGEDLRARMGRVTEQVKWIGKATDIVKSVFSLHGVNSDVKDCSTPQFTECNEEPPHTQSGTDLQLLENFARMLGYEFWYTYAASAAAPKTYTVTPSAKFMPSPDYGTPGAAIAAKPESLDSLFKTGSKTLRMDVPNGCCRNMTSFRLDVDVERASTSNGAGVNSATGEVEESKVSDPSDPVDPAATARLTEFNCTRTLSSSTESASAQREAVNRSLLAEQGWFVTAAASTSAHILPGVVQAHDIIAVEGNGFQHSGRYHVSKVIHVINTWGHLMDLSLRRNALPGAIHV